MRPVPAPALQNCPICQNVLPSAPPKQSPTGAMLLVLLPKTIIRSNKCVVPEIRKQTKARVMLWCASFRALTTAADKHHAPPLRASKKALLTDGCGVLLAPLSKRYKTRLHVPFFWSRNGMAMCACRGLLPARSEHTPKTLTCTRTSFPCQNDEGHRHGESASFLPHTL